MLTSLILAISLCAAQPVVIRFDLGRTHPISPYIYGCNFPNWEKMKLPFPVVRMGGNRMTAYNWETNASNAGNDWHHQNDGFMEKSDEPGLAVRKFLEAAQSNGAISILTVPTAGHVSADKNEDGDVVKTPDYLDKRFLKSYSTKPGKAYVYPPDTRDKAVYQDEFVTWIERTRKPEVPVWYSLDNEPDIWHSTHARIRPTPITYADLLANSIEFAAAIKQVAPKSLIFGPVNYGFMGFRTLQNASDAKGRDFLDFYLAGMKAAEAKAGRRLLDVLDVHWYPEAQGDGVRVAFGTDKPGTPAARIQAPRSLWDPSYIEDSWITKFLGNKPIVLLPTLLSQIDRHYPGSKLAITEYNYGGGQVISGAIAQADVLGIFGRYSVFAATQFGMQAGDAGQLAAFRAFLDYDGKGSQFGEVAVQVQGEQPDRYSVYASISRRKRHLMTVVVINKSTKSLQFRFEGAAGSGTAYTITSDSLTSPLRTKVESGLFQSPPLSISTLEFPLKQ